MVDKALGQHWLYNREVLDYIASEAKGVACPSDTLRAALAKSSCSAGHITPLASLALEIGPGLGTLTASLLRRFEKVVAVEFDAKLARNLPGSFPGKNLEVVNADFLKFDLAKMPEDYVIAGNIPYYITSPIIEKILTAGRLPKRAVLLIQKEVAERIADEKETGLSLFVKNRASVRLGPVVLKGEFTPPPKVDSQVIILEPFLDGPKYPDELFKLIRAAFTAPRKKLIHNLSQLKSKEELGEIFGKLGISLNARPADLHLDDYYRLYCDIM